jgi:hypothetical protein
MMTRNLPYLTRERLATIFKHVYGGDGEDGFEEEKMAHLLKTLQAMQSFNLEHRPDDTRDLYGVMSQVFEFELNSDGTTYWLAMCLAIKELYGFSNDRLVSVMKQIAPGNQV